MLCPRCEKQRDTIRISVQDPKSKKKYVVIRCFKCGYNHDIEDYIIKPEQPKLIEPPKPTKKPKDEPPSTGVWTHWNNPW